MAAKTKTAAQMRRELAQLRAAIAPLENFKAQAPSPYQQFAVNFMRANFPLSPEIDKKVTYTFALAKEGRPWGQVIFTHDASTIPVTLFGYDEETSIKTTIHEYFHVLQYQRSGKHFIYANRMACEIETEVFTRETFPRLEQEYNAFLKEAA